MRKRYNIILVKNEYKFESGMPKITPWLGFYIGITIGRRREGHWFGCNGFGMTSGLRAVRPRRLIVSKRRWERRPCDSSKLPCGHG